MPAVATQRVPHGFGAVARANSYFPIVISSYAVLYSIWWPFAWGLPGGIAFGAVVLLAVFFVARGIVQVRHAMSFPNDDTEENARIGKQMGILNSVTHPIWMIGTIVLLILGQGRWVLPLMIFVIGAHFLPMAHILNRKIDYLLGPIAMASATWAGVLAFNDQASWLVVFSVAGIGGTLSTLGYALYMSKAYQRLCHDAGVPFPTRNVT